MFIQNYHLLPSFLCKFFGIDAPNLFDCFLFPVDYREGSDKSDCGCFANDVDARASS